MHASIFLLAAAAGSALAQSSTTSSTSSSVPASGCGTQIDTIIASCLGTTQAQLSACAVNDWDCMCTQITNVLTCYNNCPSDPNRAAAVSQQTSWCQAASAFPSTSTHATMTGTGMSTAISASNTASTTTTNSVATGYRTTGTGNPEPTNSEGAAVANVVYPGLAAIFFGFAALV